MSDGLGLVFIGLFGIGLIVLALFISILIMIFGEIIENDGND